MGEDQNKSTEERFEEGLRQILDSAPSGSRGAAERPPKAPSRPEDAPWKMPAGAEAEPKALFWFKLLRPLAILTALALMTMLILRITAAKG